MAEEGNVGSEDVATQDAKADACMTEGGGYGGQHVTYEHDVTGRLEWDPNKCPSEALAQLSSFDTLMCLPVCVGG